MSLKAPLGHKIVVSDLSGIELRLNHYLWQVASSQEAFAADPEADLYRSFAAEHLYRIRPEGIDKTQRQVGKVAQLGLGFGAGASTFKRVAKTMGGVALSDEEADHIKCVWREAYSEIVKGWRMCQQAIGAMLAGTEMVIDPLGLCVTGRNCVRLPSGRTLYYPELREEWVQADTENPDTGKWEYMYGCGRNISRIYGPLFDENIVQAIARDVILYHALRIHALTGKLPSLMVHDELVYVVPERQAEEHLKTVLSVMRKPPKWLPGIVLWSEGDIGGRYGEAK
jgi:DNA polymerase